jgi:O-Antigen ligase
VPTRRLLPPRIALAAGPTALAFFAGGYFSRPRLVALVVAAGVLAWAAVAAPRPLPRRGAGALALGALFAFAGWVALSRRWSPLPADAAQDAERVVLYALTLPAAVACWRERRAARALEPALAAGALIVIGYGLAGRLLLGLIHERATGSAGGRLEQPLTYWNATGALAAIGFVLCARLAGDRTRPVALRCAAAAGAVPLGTGVYLSFSRGAFAALAAGLAMLVVLARDRAQLRAALICVAGAALAGVPAGLSDGVRALEGTMSHREAQGAAVLVGLLVVMAATAAVVRWEAGARAGRLVLPTWATRAVLVGAAALIVVVPLVAGHRETSPAGAFGATNARFAELGSNRYDYWEVAARAFGDHPLKGVGSSGFAAEWLRHRTIPERVHDAHSLVLETVAELGIVGLALLAVVLVAVMYCAIRAQEADPILAPGFAAALTVWLLHANVDWDWEMPAVTLVALVLAGSLIAAAERRRPAER